jgi:hypothetical protein
MFSRYTLFGGRRKGPRRQGDPTAVYVDQLGTGIFVILVLTFFFHCLDAFFTLLHLSDGGRELNPVMDYYIRIGPGAFLTVKLGLSALGLCFLGIHKNFPLVKKGIILLFLLYAGVVAYQVFLMWQPS